MAATTAPELPPGPLAVHLPTDKSRNRGDRAEERVGWVMIAPATILLLIFLAVPVGLAAYLSFTNERLVSPPGPPDFVGFDNYVRAFTDDPTFLASVRNIIVFALVVVPMQGGLGLVLALLVNQRLRAITAFRVMYFVPVITSIIVVSMLWRFLYNRDGLVNALFGLDVDWLNEPRTALGAIIVMSVWQSVGFHMIIWLAGLQTIPETLYEAARIDGANAWQQFRFVTVPGLRPTLIFVLITITIAAFSLFAQIDVMTRGGPLDSTTTIVYHIVQRGYSSQQVGYGAALSLIFFAMVMVITLVQRRLTRED